MGVPSHSTVEPGTKPLPVIVTVGLLPIGADVGARLFMVGAGSVTVSTTVWLTVAPDWSVTVTVA